MFSDMSKPKEFTTSRLENKNVLDIIQAKEKLYDTK